MPSYPHGFDLLIALPTKEGQLPEGFASLRDFIRYCETQRQFPRPLFRGDQINALVAAAGHPEGWYAADPQRWYNVRANESRFPDFIQLCDQAKKRLAASDDQDAKADSAGEAEAMLPAKYDPPQPLKYQDLEGIKQAVKRLGDIAYNASEDLLVVLERLTATGPAVPASDQGEKDFDTGITALDDLLQEVYWLGQGRGGGHDAAMLFMERLEVVKQRLAAADDEVTELVAVGRELLAIFYDEQAKVSVREVERLQNALDAIDALGRDNSDSMAQESKS